MMDGGTELLRESLYLTTPLHPFLLEQYLGDDCNKRWLFLGGGTRNLHLAFSMTASLSLSFVRNADKLSIHTKCSSHPIGCCVPM